MREIIIYGLGELGKRALRNITYYKEYIVIGGYDKNENIEMGSLPRIDLLHMVDAYGDKAVVICIANKRILREVYIWLRNLGYKKIFFFLNKDRCYGTDFLCDECVFCGQDFEAELPSVEMHVVDFCNLNCRGCSHFSPLFPREFPDLNERVNDLVCLNQKAKIRLLYLLGGEPLLNKELGRYIVEIRKKLSDVAIQVVTNGLLIPHIEEKLLLAFKENNITVIVSEYEPTHSIIEQIKKRLENYQIDYSIRNWDEKQMFNMPITVNDNTIHKHKCISDGCVTVWNGKIACCPTLMYVERFNSEFSQSLPMEGIYGLDKLNCTGIDLCELIYKKIPLCAHCVEYPIEWSRSKKELVVEDFAVLN